MKSSKLKIGLVVAKPNSEISELNRFLPDKQADIFLFPEGFLHSDNLDTACQVVKANNKETDKQPLSSRATLSEAEWGAEGSLSTRPSPATGIPPLRFTSVGMTERGKFIQQSHNKWLITGMDDR